MDNPDAGTVRAHYARAGVPIPAGLHPPPVWSGFEQWFNDFWELGTERQVGMGVGPIPKGAIDRHVAGWPKAEAALFWRLIRMLDNMFLERRAAESKARN